MSADTTTIAPICAHCGDTIAPGDACPGRPHYHVGCHVEIDRAWRQSPAGHPKRLAIVRDYARRHPDRIAARKAVRNAVKRGELPPAYVCPCVSCGAVAAHWDHHMGYAKKHRLTVQPLCAQCHYEVRRLRGEVRGQVANRAIVGFVRPEIVRDVEAIRAAWKRARDQRVAARRHHGKRTAR